MGRPRHHPPQCALCAPGRGLCSANKAEADTPEKALVPNLKAIPKKGTQRPPPQHAALHFLRGD